MGSGAFLVGSKLSRGASRRRSQRSPRFAAGRCRAGDGRSSGLESVGLNASGSDRCDELLTAAFAYGRCQVSPNARRRRREARRRARRRSLESKVEVFVGRGVLLNKLDQQCPRNANASINQEPETIATAIERLKSIDGAVRIVSVPMVSGSNAPERRLVSKPAVSARPIWPPLAPNAHGHQERALRPVGAAAAAAPPLNLRFLSS